MGENVTDTLMNFRELKSGSLVGLLEWGEQQIVFEGIIKGKPPTKQGPMGSDDLAILICLDPVGGLERREYPLNKSGFLKDSGYSSVGIDEESKEGRKYLKLITGE